MHSNKIKIFVGDVSECLALKAKSHDSSAVLLTSSTDQVLIPGTYYVSLGDLQGLLQFGNYLQQADEIYYIEPQKWSDKKLKEWTEDYLSVFVCDKNKKVYGYNDTEYEKIDKMLSLTSNRKSADSQIWIAGCSISHGVGVLDEQRYGHLISKSLDMPVNFLTRAGSSIEWASSQILRADIKKGDVIFWGLTSPSRIHYWNESTSAVDVCVDSSFYLSNKKPLHKFLKKNYFINEHAIFKAIESISMVENMMHKIGVTLIMGTVLCGLEKFLIPKPNIVVLAGMFGREIDSLFCDLGSDNLHPGPITHQYYCDKFIQAYKQIQTQHHVC